MRVRFIGLLVLGLAGFLLASCADSTGVPFQQADRGIVVFLAKQSKGGINGMVVNRDERGSAFSFNEGAGLRKVKVILPVRVRAQLTPLREGEDSALTVKAHKQGLFFKGNRAKTAEDWRKKILQFLKTEF